MDFSVLGPLQVRVRGEAVPVRRGLPRLLLLYLLLHPGEPVAASVLADRMWNGQPPVDPANAVHRVVSYVRHTLGGAGDNPLRTTSAGYVLDVSPAAVDSTRFRQRVKACGAAATPSLPLLEEALSMWRGEPLADAAGLPWAAPFIAELEELHLRAQEMRLTSLLDLGRHVDAVPRAQALVATCPLRESLRTSLMLALYRSGRQSEALAAAAALRRTLADELGIDPSPAVLDLEQRILHQDPALAAPPSGATPAVQGPAPEVPAPPRSAAPEAAAGQPPAGASRPFLTRRAVTSLIGRDEDVARVSAAFGEAGLLTLTGPGGTGKTRLALALLQRHPDLTVWFADLSSAADDATVASVAAAATGAPTSPGTDVVDAVVAHLTGRAGVLVLDTCEHVVRGAAALAAAVLHACPEVRQLATSRRPLGVTGEVIWPVPPLMLPPPPGSASTAAVRAAASVELFAKRAAAVRPDFRIDDTNAADVAGICRSLDGLPLAIELAAAHVDVLSTAKIRSRLDDRFALLVSDTRDVIARQRSLRAAITSSVELLTPDEHAFFTHLAVFAGTFDLEAAVAVAPRSAGRTEDDSFRLLASLLRQSLVSRAGPDRYRLLDSLRAYAAELLDALPESAGARRRHAEHHVAMAEAADLKVRTGAQQFWLALLREAQPDLRAALGWCLDGNAPELGARLVGALAWFWTLEGLLAEARQWLDRAEQVTVTDARVRSRVLLGVGLVAAPLGSLPQARDACAEAADLSRSVGDDRGTGDALITLGVALWGLGDLDGAAAAHDEAIQRLSTEDGGWRRHVAVVLRARTAIDRGEADAGHQVTAALVAARSSQDAHLVGLALTQQARHELRAGRVREAVAAAEQSLAANRWMGHPEGEAAALTLLARARVAAAGGGDDPGAATAVEQAVSTAAAIDHRGALCHAVEALAAVRAAAGEEQEALTLIEVAAAERRNRGIPSPRVEGDLTKHLTESLRSRLGPCAAAAAAHVAAATTVDDVAAQVRRGYRGVPAPAVGS